MMDDQAEDFVSIDLSEEDFEDEEMMQKIIDQINDPESAWATKNGISDVTADDLARVIECIEASVTTMFKFYFSEFDGVTFEEQKEAAEKAGLSFSEYVNSAESDFFDLEAFFLAKNLL